LAAANEFQKFGGGYGGRIFFPQIFGGGENFGGSGYSATAGKSRPVPTCHMRPSAWFNIALRNP